MNEKVIIQSKLFVITFLVLALVKCNNTNESNTLRSNKIDYSFFIAGHTYGKPGVDNVGVHPPFKNKFDLIKNDKTIKFGVLTGDIVWAGTEKNWNEIDADLTLLDKPIYFAAGNHDLGNRELFESRYGSTYRSFTHNSDLFIVLDPNIDHWNISGNQLDFLKNTLKNNYKKVDNIFVFHHQLLWRTSNNIYKKIYPNSLEGRAATINFWSEVEPLFNQLPNNVFMFAGDVGAFNNGSEYMYHRYENITFIASGMGGEVNDNIVIIDVRKDKTINFRLIALNGNDINSLGKLEDFVLK